MKRFLFGTTSKGTEIWGFRQGAELSRVARALVLGGVHGDEVEGVIAAHGLLAGLETLAPELALDLTIVPEFNVDGVRAGTRVNARGVDLNRNLPTQDWNPKAFNDRYPPGPSANSEPENQALTVYLEKLKPDFILSLHSWKPLLNTNGDCLLQAQAIAEKTGYEIVPSIGYPTPGCLGTYAGLERGWPTLTYEIERGLDRESILKIHVPAVQEALRVTSNKKAKNGEAHS